MIRFVTMTGADDSVSLNDLVKISKAYPFVEWGILISRTCEEEGRPRFPSKKWIEQLSPKRLIQANDAPDANAIQGIGMNFALHVCGSYVRNFFKEGRADFFDHVGDAWPVFQRIQLNTHGEVHPVTPKSYEIMKTFFQAHSDKEFILQQDEVNEKFFHMFKDDGIKNVSALFDGSHGAGVLPGQWRSPQRSDSSYGFAGGLGPDNLKANMVSIWNAWRNLSFPPQPYWVDMETKVRSDDDLRFDLEKVCECLDIATRFIEVYHPSIKI